MGEAVIEGNILVRQKGNSWHPGRGVGQGRDFTLYALRSGFVRFSNDEVTKRTFISVEPRDRYEELSKIRAFTKARRSPYHRGKLYPHFCPEPSLSYAQFLKLTDTQMAAFYPGVPRVTSGFTRQQEQWLKIPERSADKCYSRFAKLKPLSETKQSEAISGKTRKPRVMGGEREEEEALDREYEEEWDHDLEGFA